MEKAILRNKRVPHVYLRDIYRVFNLKVDR
jgi:hypothetical protein